MYPNCTAPVFSSIKWKQYQLRKCKGYMGLAVKGRHRFYMYGKQNKLLGQNSKHFIGILKMCLLLAGTQYLNFGGILDIKKHWFI